MLTTRATSSGNIAITRTPTKPPNSSILPSSSTNSLTLEQQLTPTQQQQQQSSLLPTPIQRRKTSAGGKAGRKKWTANHIVNLLNLVESHRPTGRDKWDIVSTIFNTGMDQPYQRSGTQLKEKFFALSRGRGTTGNPDLGEHCIRARRIEEEIERSVHVTYSRDPYTITNNNTNNNNDQNEEEKDHDSDADDNDNDNEDDDDDAGYVFEDSQSAANILTSDNSLPMLPSIFDASTSSLPPVDSQPSSSASSLNSPTFSSSSSSSNPSPLQPKGKRKRQHLETTVREALEKEEANRSAMNQALAAMATAVAAMASQSQASDRRQEEAARRHEEAQQRFERRHEELMAILLVNSKKD